MGRGTEATLETAREATIALLPTQAEFVACEKPYKGYVGGRGAGKSHVGAYDYLVHCLPNTVGLVISPCYDDQTEILTQERGWQLFRNLQPTDAVATLQDGERLEYHIPSEWHDVPYQGELIYLCNQEIDLAMTPNHRCYTKFKKNGEWEIRTAEWLYGRWDRRFKKTATWVDSATTEEEILYYEFLGFWFAEGCAQTVGTGKSGNRYRVIVTQKKYCEYAEKLVSVAAKRWRPDGKWSRHAKGPNRDCFNYTITSRTMSETFVRYGKSHTKAVPQWVKDSSVTLLRAFLRGYIAGDGHAKVGSHDQTNMITKSRQLADDIQEIAFKAGFSTCQSWQPSTQMYYVCIRTGKKNEPGTRPQHWSRKPYDGRVYCVKVPGGLVYVRRNGKPIWCGNTYKMLMDSTQRTFIQQAEKLGLWDWKQFRKTDNVATLNNGHEVLFRSGEEPDKLRGSTVQRIWGDECSLLKESVYSIAIACLRWQSSTPLTFAGTFTPNGKEHWTWRVFGDHTNPNVGLFHSSTRDNCFLPDDFYDRLKLQYGKGEGGELLAAQELEGQFVCVEGAEWGAEPFSEKYWFDDWPKDDQAIKVINLDTSKGQGGKTGDYACFAKIMLSHGILYVEFVMDNRWNASVISDQLIDLYRSFQPHYVGIEAEFGGEVLASDLDTKCTAANILIPLCLVPTGGVQKEVRIRRLTPYITRRMIRWRNTPQTKIGLAQFESWPFSEHDDGPDATEGGVRIINETGILAEAA